MKYNTIIIGGGLSGLTAGIALLKAGQKVAIISKAQNTLHFNSGSFSLLGYDKEGKAVGDPIAAIKDLDAKHPYQKIGAENVEKLADEAKALLAEAGIHTEGTSRKNHLRVTPIGALKPEWLTMEGMIHTDENGQLPAKAADLVNIEGYLDLPVELLADGLKKAGMEVTSHTVTTLALENARRSPSEMRASNIALVLQSEDEIRRVADAINALSLKSELVLLPAVLGYRDSKAVEQLKQLVRKPLLYVATLPPSVSGIRANFALRRQFAALGGTLIPADAVTKSAIEAGRVINVETEKMEGTRFEADQYILATGSFVSEGLQSNYEKVWEPVFGLDVFAPGRHQDWSVDYLYDAQPYMEFGVETDKDFHPAKDGGTISNLYAIGSVLSGHNSVKLADGTGVSLITALAVAKHIISGK